MGPKYATSTNDKHLSYLFLNKNLSASKYAWLNIGEGEGTLH